MKRLCSQMIVNTSQEDYNSCMSSISAAQMNTPLSTHTPVHGQLSAPTADYDLLLQKTYPCHLQGRRHAVINT